MAKQAPSLTANVGQRTQKGTLVTQQIKDAADADWAGVLEIREDNAQQIADAIDQALAKALEEVGLVAEGYAKKACPVDTGRLRNSITHQVRPSEKSVYIGTNVEYAPYVELGTSRMKLQPFLRPAAADHEGTYKKIFESELKK
nr:MAG TPA: putative tail component [Caudoviricetes sp.]